MWCTLCCSFQKNDCHAWLVDKMKFAHLRQIWVGPFSLLFQFPFSLSRPNMTGILLTGTFSVCSINPESFAKGKGHPNYFQTK